MLVSYHDGDIDNDIMDDDIVHLHPSRDHSWIACRGRLFGKWKPWSDAFGSPKSFSVRLNTASVHNDSKQT